MYLDFFGLTEKPFSLTPDTQLFFNHYSHREALNTLLLALGEGEGFIKIVGEVGTGKTILCRMLLNQLHDSCYATAFVPNPWLTPEELKSFLASEIGANYHADMPSHELMSSIYRKLVQLARADKKVILLIDEAQAMPVETIESLRLLTNLEGEKRKLLQVVMFGQPELDVLLARNNLRQLKQRIVFSENLHPLSLPAVKEYLFHRLQSCGASENLMDPAAAWLIYKASGGIPRLVNILAHKALLSAYGKADEHIAPWHVAKAIEDTHEIRISGKLIGAAYRLMGKPHKLSKLGAIS